MILAIKVFCFLVLVRPHQVDIKLGYAHVTIFWWFMYDGVEQFMKQDTKKHLYEQNVIYENTHKHDFT